MSNRSPKQIGSLFLTVYFLLLTLATSASAQTTNATLNGIVEDSDGKAVPGVKVTITNSGTGLERTIVTDENGAYVFPLLPPATYTVLAEANGFRRVSFPDIVLNVGDRRLLRIELQVGEVGAEVLVNPEDAFLVNTTTAVGTTIDRTFVSQLPLNGRSFQSLILLTPGVTITSTNGTEAGQFSVNGQRPSTNVFLVDGVGANVGISSVTNPGGAQNAAMAGAYPGTSALGSTASLVSVDALEEFKIQTSTTAAEFGRQPGGQISLVTRSGKDRFQGTVYEYFRNEALDARNYFNTESAPEIALRQNIFGGTFSGPIFLPNFGDGGPGWYNGRKRSFFFFSYEGQRLKLPRSGIVYVPSERLRNNITSPGMRQLISTFPLGNGAETTWDHDNNPSTAQVLSGWAPLNYAVSSPSNLDATSIRIDHAITGKHLLFGRFNDSPSNSASSTPLIVTDSIASTRTLTVGLTSAITASVNNEFRVNFSQGLAQSVTYPPTDGAGVPFSPSVLVPSGFDGSIVVPIFGFGGQSSVRTMGDTVVNRQNQMNIVDNVTLLKGPHQFKFGVDYRRLTPSLAARPSLAISFNTESRVISGTANSVTVTNTDAAHPRFTNFSLFAQDTWRVNSRLTLDLGIRYELNPAPTERDGKLPIIVIGVTDPADLSGAALAPSGTPFYKTFYTAFAPRFGAAYQVRTKPGSETILRGGFGIFYDLGASAATAAFPRSAARTLTNITVPLSEANAALPAVSVPTSLPITAIAYTSPQNLRLPYSFHWNLGVEQSLGASQVISLSYVASAARQLMTQQQVNGVPATGQPRPNPNFGAIFLTSNGPTSDYHSMQTQYRMRLKRGLQALVNYTWSHAIDEVSSDLGSLTLERGNANFDVRHNFSAAFHYDIPRFKTGGVIHALIRDWAVDAIVHAQSGRPVDITGATTIEDGRGVLLRPNLVPGQPLYIEDSSVQGARRFNTAAFSANLPNPQSPGRLLQGNFGRNVMRELPIYQTDLSLGRTFPFSETVKLQLKADAFNVFNHPHFAGYNTTISSSNFGVPTTTLNSSLGGLSQLYQIGGPRSIQLSARLSF